MKTVQKLERVSLTDKVKSELLRLIMAGGLSIGERLNEVRLAREMGVSRGPIREAARRLEGEGLIVSRPRQGFFVADMTADQIVEIYDFKTYIDPAIIDDFLRYSDHATKMRLLNDVDTIETGEKLIFAKTLFEYRCRIAERLHNRYLTEAALSLYRRFYLVTVLLDVEDECDRMHRIIATQREFWSAMIARDQNAALEIMSADGEYWRWDLAPRFAQLEQARSAAEEEGHAAEQ